MTERRCGNSCLPTRLLWGTIFLCFIFSATTSASVDPSPALVELCVRENCPSLPGTPKRADIRYYWSRFPSSFQEALNGSNDTELVLAAFRNFPYCPPPTFFSEGACVCQAHSPQCRSVLEPPKTLNYVGDVVAWVVPLLLIFASIFILRYQPAPSG